MASTIPSRVSPVVVLALAGLAPVTVLGAGRFLAPDLGKPALETQARAGTIGEFMVIPPHATPERDASRAPPSPLPPPSVPCGNTTCAAGNVCCEPRCGICTMPGETCARQDCGFASHPGGAPCGATTCNVGQVCCDSKCGLCAPVAECADLHC